MSSSEIESTAMPHRVVVGVDGSPASFRALQWALGYASATNSPVEVVVAWEWPTVPAWSAPIPSDFDPDMSAEHLLEHVVAQKRAEYPDLEIDGQVVQGKPASVLESASRGAALMPATVRLSPWGI